MSLYSNSYHNLRYRESPLLVVPGILGEDLEAYISLILSVHQVGCSLVELPKVVLCQKTTDFLIYGGRPDGFQTCENFIDYYSSTLPTSFSLLVSL